MKRAQGVNVTVLVFASLFLVSLGGLLPIVGESGGFAPISGGSKGSGSFDIFDDKTKEAMKQDAVSLSKRKFIRNEGQIDFNDIMYYSQCGDVYFTPTGVIYRFREMEPVKTLDSDQHKTPESVRDVHETYHERGVVLKYSFIGANDVVPEGRAKCQWSANFFIGSGPDNWHTDVPVFEEIFYHNVWDGIDIVYRSCDGQLKYDLLVGPGSDPSMIDFKIEGMIDIRTKDQTMLIIGTELGDIIDTGLIAIQNSQKNGQVKCRFRLTGIDSYGFEVGPYDRSKELIIDPLLFSTFIGGGQYDDARDIDVDDGGFAYVVGETISADYPTTIGAYDRTLSSSYDIFITKMDPSGSSLVFSTFVGGNGKDTGNGVSLDHNGNVIITGQTGSSDFPVTSDCLDASFNGGTYDIFVSKLENGGNSLNYSSYLGGSNDDIGKDITIDDDGSVYITGYSRSTDYPTTKGAFNTTSIGNEMVVLTKIDLESRSLRYSTFLGGKHNDFGNGVAVDEFGHAYLTGFTHSDDFPTTPNCHDNTYNGKEDIFVSKMSRDGGSLIYSTYLGGDDYDEGYAIGLDDDGCVYVTGSVRSWDFPTTKGAFSEVFNLGTDDACICKLSANGSSLVYSSYFGGSEDEYGNSIVVDGDGCAYITGKTNSDNLPTSNDAISMTKNGMEDAFIAKISKNGNFMVYCTYLGGFNIDMGYAIEVDQESYVYVVGSTFSTDFQVTDGAFDTTQNDNYDAFVTKLRMPKCPSRPENFLIEFGDSALLLKWDPPMKDGWVPVTNYLIYRGPKPGEETLLRKVGDVRSYFDEMVNVGQTYYYMVTALNSAGESPGSVELCVVPMSVPSPPMTLRAVPENGMVTLNWTKPNSDGYSPIIGYNVYRGVIPGGVSPFKFLGVVHNFTDHNVTNGKTYYYKVSALNSIGEGLLSEEVNAVPLAAPSAPLNLYAIPGPGQVFIGWTGPASDGGSPILNYSIYRGSGSGTESFYDLTDNGLSYLDHRVTSGQTYYYRVAAINRIGEGPLSDEVFTVSAQGPSSPLDLTATSDDGSVTLNWAPPAFDGGSAIINYILYRGPNAGDEQFYEILDEGLTYTDLKVSNGKPYYYQVSAMNSVAEGDRSAEVMVIPGKTPSKPLEPHARPGDMKVFLSWTAPILGGGVKIIGYNIYRNTSPLSPVIYKINNSGTSYIDDDVMKGQTYYYRISAVNPIGEGLLSDEVWARPGTVPSSPKNPRAHPGDRSVNLTWDAPGSDGDYPIEGYMIYRSQTPGGKELLSTSGNELSYVDTNVINDKVYYYQVSAFSTIGEGNLSDEVSTRPGKAPEAPQDFKAEPGDGKVILTWSAPFSIGGYPVEGYNIYRGTAPGEEVHLTRVVNIEEYLDLTVKNGLTYYYQISAFNVIGEGERAEEIQVKPGPNVKETSSLMLFALILAVVLVVTIAIAISIFIIIRGKRTESLKDIGSKAGPDQIEKEGDKTKENPLNKVQSQNDQEYRSTKVENGPADIDGTNGPEVGTSEPNCPIDMPH